MNITSSKPNIIQNIERNIIIENNKYKSIIVVEVMIKSVGNDTKSQNYLYQPGLNTNGALQFNFFFLTLIDKIWRMSLISQSNLGMIITIRKIIEGMSLIYFSVKV